MAERRVGVGVSELCRLRVRWRCFFGAVHFFFQAEDGIRVLTVTGVQTCALPIYQALRIAEATEPGAAPLTIELPLASDGSYTVRMHFPEDRTPGGRSWVCVDQYSGKVDRKSTRLNSSHSQISYAVFCLKKKKLQR